MKQIFKLCWLFVLCYWTITAQTAYGSIGVKVWIFNGEVIGKV